MQQIQAASYNHDSYASVRDRSSTYSAYFVPVSTLGIGMGQGVQWTMFKPAHVFMCSTDHSSLIS